MLSNSSYEEPYPTEEESDRNSESGRTNSIAQGFEPTHKPCCYDLRNLCNLQRWKYPTASEVRALEWLFAAVGLGLASAGIVAISVRYNGSLLAFSIESILIASVSIPIIVRFREKNFVHGPISRRRDIRSTCATGLILFVLATLIFVSAIVHLSATQRNSSALTAISFIASLLCLIFASLLLHVGLVLIQPSVVGHSIGLFAFGIHSMAIFAGSLAANVSDSLWFVDPVISLLVGLALGVYSFTLFRKYGWYKRSFWSIDYEGEHVDEAEDRDDSLTPDSGIDLKPIDMDMV